MSKFDTVAYLKELTDIGVLISDTVYTSERPKISLSKLNDFVVVSFPVTLYNRIAYGSTFLRIELYARDKEDGFENLERLEEMKDIALSNFPINNQYFKALTPRLLMKGTDGYGFHCWIIQATVFIK